MPGNKVFVTSGLLSVCDDVDGLAAVLSHEIAHCMASHSAERMSYAWAISLTSGCLLFTLGLVPGLVLYGLWSTLGGLYLQELLFYLPMTRRQEMEADYRGLMLMVDACYDPRAAEYVWRCLTELDDDFEPHVEPLGTHPTVRRLARRPSGSVTNAKSWRRVSVGSPGSGGG